MATDTHRTDQRGQSNGSEEGRPERFFRRIETDRELSLAGHARLLGGTIEDIRFTDCTILGPAIVEILPNPPTGLVDCVSTGPVEPSFWSLPDGTRPLGIVGVIGCRFERCTFDRITFAVHAEEERAWIEENVSFRAER